MPAINFKFDNFGGIECQHAGGFIPELLLFDFDELLINVEHIGDRRKRRLNDFIHHVMKSGDLWYDYVRKCWRYKL